MSQEILDLAQSLSTACATSGNEAGVAQLSVDFLKSIGEANVTNLGSVSCLLKNNNSKKPAIMLSAHLDQVGMVVTNVLENGFLKVAAVGGLDRRLLPAQRVKIFTQTKIIDGVVCSVPPHLQDGKEAVLKMEEVLIDTGLCEKQAEILSVGDMVCFSPNFKVLNGKFITSPALDNRIGCVAVMLAAQQLCHQSVDCNVSVLLTSQEEAGGAGAMADVAVLNPQMAVCVDVSFANGFAAPKEKCGDLGKGAMLGLSPVLNRKMYCDMLDICKKNNIPYQTEIMGGRTGTDADSIATTENGVKTALLSIPLRNMHTPIELACTDDVQTVIDAIVAFVKEVSIC